MQFYTAALFGIIAAIPRMQFYTAALFGIIAAIPRMQSYTAAPFGIIAAIPRMQSYTTAPRPGSWGKSFEAKIAGNSSNRRILLGKFA